MSVILPFSNYDINSEPSTGHPGAPTVSGVAEVWDVNCDELRFLSIQANTTEVSVPFQTTMAIKASNDGSNFVDVDGTTVSLSGTTTQLWSIADPTFKYARVSYTPVSGSGQLAIFPYGKGLAG